MGNVRNILHIVTNNPFHSLAIVGNIRKNIREPFSCVGRYMNRVTWDLFAQTQIEFLTIEFRKIFQ